MASLGYKQEDCCKNHHCEIVHLVWVLFPFIMFGKHAVRRNQRAKKDVQKYVLVGYKDVLQCHVHHIDEIIRPKSLVPGATVRTRLYGEFKKGTVVTTSTTEESLKNQADVLDVGRFFGLSRKRSSVIGNLPRKEINEKVSTSTNLASGNLTSTPASSKHRHVMVQNLPSPIKFNGTLTFSHEQSYSYAFDSTSYRLYRDVDKSVENIEDIVIPLVEVSYDETALKKKSSSPDHLTARRSINFEPKVEFSMAFSSFSSNLDSIISKINLINISEDPAQECRLSLAANLDIPQNAGDELPEITPMLTGKDKHAVAYRPSVSVATVTKHCVSSLDTTYNTPNEFNFTKESQNTADCCSSSSTKLSEALPIVTNLPSNTDLSDVSSPNATNTNSFEGSLALADGDSTILYGMDTSIIDSPQTPCVISRLRSDTHYEDFSFNYGGRSDESETSYDILPGVICADPILAVTNSCADKPVSTATNSTVSIDLPTKHRMESELQTKDGTEELQTVSSRAEPYEYTKEKYVLDDEGDIHMMTILDNLLPSQLPQSVPIPDFEELALYTNALPIATDTTISDHSNIENIPPIYDAPTDLCEDGIQVDRQHFLQMTPSELIHGILLKPEYPSRINTYSSQNTHHFLHLKTISPTPEVFARNLMYRMFTLAEFEEASVYGRGFTNGIRNSPLNSDKVRLIRKVTFELYKDFSWRHCVLWMDKSIRYVNRLVHVH